MFGFETWNRQNSSENVCSDFSKIYYNTNNKFHAMKSNLRVPISATVYWPAYDIIKILLQHVPIAIISEAMGRYTSSYPATGKFPNLFETKIRSCFVSTTL